MDESITISPEPVTTEDQALISLSRAQLALDDCKTVMEAKQISDLAEAARVYLQRTHQSLETVNRATEIRILAERQMGLFLKEMPKAKGGAPYHKKNSTPLDTQGVKTLTQIGITEMQAAQAQKLGDILELDIKDRIAETKAKGEKLSVAKVLAEPRKVAKAVMPLPDIVSEMYEAAKAVKGDTSQREQTTKKAMLKVLSRHFPNHVGALSDKPATVDDIYKAYPRHKQPTSARKAIEKAMVREKLTADALLEITLKYAAAIALWPASELQWVPYPASWFNAGSFLEDPKEWTRDGAKAAPKKGAHDL